MSCEGKEEKNNNTRDQRVKKAKPVPPQKCPYPVMGWMRNERSPKHLPASQRSSSRDPAACPRAHTPPRRPPHRWQAFAAPVRRRRGRVAKAAAPQARGLGVSPGVPTPPRRNGGRPARGRRSVRGCSLGRGRAPAWRPLPRACPSLSALSARRRARRVLGVCPKSRPC